MMEQAPTHEPGEQFGPFMLERPLGRGAAAEVWQAVESGDLGFTKRQALKLLQPPPGEMETQKKALINEARVCGRLKHPGVVDVYKVGEQNGELYIAMEFVDGPDLNTLLVALRKRGVVIPLKAAMEATVDLAEALDYAHTAEDDEGVQLGIVHRDLKPSNVLVDRRGSLKISDWGLVKSILNIESTTRGIVKGTPGYIAPEVWGGTRDFKPAADLFAVGAMLYEFVVGERLFQGRNLARIAEQVARRKPEEEAARVADRSPALVPVLTKLLQRAPGRRYQTGAELVEDLRPLAEQADGINLKSFLRSVRPVVDEIAPQRSTQRLSKAAASGPAPLAATESVPSTPAVAPVSGPTPAESEDESDMTATDEQPALKPHQLGPDSAPPEPPTAELAPEAISPASTDPEKAPVPASFITGSGRVEGAEMSVVPETRTMPIFTRMPKVPVPVPVPKPEPITVGGAGVDVPPVGAARSGGPARPSGPGVGPDGQPRKRRRRRRPPPPPKKMPPPALAAAVAVFGFLILLIGAAAFFASGGLELLNF
ncbi:MAG: protein kinase [Proteobacteria bacterium]|nr:protein kinase [Pseudomonadota bacterium]